MKSKNILSSILLLTLGIFGCGAADEHAGEEATGTVSVAVHTVRSGQVDLRFVASGTLGGSQTAV
jgi:hypothetical protein